MAKKIEDEGTQIKPTEIESTKIEPTEVKPTEIEPTKVEPTEIEPTKVEPTKIEPTKIEPTKIEPTDIKPSEIKPLKPLEPKFSSRNTAVLLAIATVAGIWTFIMGLGYFYTNLFMFIFFVALTGIVLFTVFADLKKMKVTQADLDAWNNQILANHPNFNQNQLMKLEDLNKNVFNRFSYWTHTFKKGVLKILAWVALCFSVIGAGAGVVSHIATGGSAGANVVGTYVYECNSGGNMACASSTAYKFNKDGTYVRGYYDYEDKSYHWESSKHTYKKSGSKVSVQGGSFTIKNGGKTLVDPYNGKMHKKK